MKALITTVAILMFSQLSFAQSNAKEEIKRLSTNVTHAEHNLKQYQDNLVQVEANISEVSKAKAKLAEQEKKVASELKVYEEELARFNENEKRLRQEQEEERKALAEENKKLAEVKALLERLEHNKKIREDNIINYDLTISAVQEEKKQWEVQLNEFRNVHKEASRRLATVEKQETEWSNKKRGYEGEINRWNREISRQKDLHRTYSSLAEK